MMRETEGVLGEKQALVRELNARSAELAAERAEGEQRRRGHQQEKEELERQLCAPARGFLPAQWRCAKWQGGTGAE